MWTRGDQTEYDLWGETVNDIRWSYDGQLPYMKKTETFWSNTTNTNQHGWGGPVKEQSDTSLHRAYPLYNYTLASWEAVGVKTLPGLDGNAGMLHLALRSKYVASPRSMRPFV